MSNRMMYALSFAVFGMGTRFLIYMLEWDYSIAVQLYFLYLLLAIFLGMRESFVQSPQMSFNPLFKLGAQAGSVFTLLVTGFTYLFYRMVDTQFFDQRIAGRIEEARALGYTPEQIETLAEGAAQFLNPTVQTFATFVGFMMLSLSYSALVGLILTKVPYFGKKI